MKKIYAFLGAILISGSAMSQVVINNASVHLYNMPKNNTGYKLYDSITNMSATSTTVSYNISSQMLLQGWSGKGICDKISCWPFDQNVHSFTLNPGETSQIYIDMGALPTAADGTSNAIVTVKEDGITIGTMQYFFSSGPTSIKDVDNNPLVNMFPNPASSFVNFTVLDSRVAQVFITNVVGKKIMSHDLRNNGSTVRLSLDNVADGIYMVQLADAKGHVLGVKRLTVK
jgi:hypothetical protein